MILKLKELYKYRNMIITYTRSEVRNRYKGSVLGILWALLNPVFLLIIYGFVFSFIMRIQIENYFLFLFTGLLPWIYFRSSVLGSANSILSNAGLIKKVYFPREILPISVSLSNLVNYLIGLVVLLAALIIWGKGFSIYILYLPVNIIVQLILTTGLSIFFGAITVNFRDMRQILEVVMMGMFYYTPILYSVDMIPEKFLWLMNLNPLKPIIETYQDILFFQNAPNLKNLGLVFIISLIITYLSFIIFNRLNKSFAEKI
ncbi:ABC transporter permease [Bacillus sp. HMF5848]|uniref:ABC transporter permease n=1 Tax=Bacillus sp. HMF5848 TaxID=2495421 RepID=UPI000F7BA2E5|nr:ABC transporter permease [Bacillus sp. HMF5848]RSK28672.1 ABC transporter permease [Bacillus sp. HMF5848]